MATDVALAGDRTAHPDSFTMNGLDLCACAARPATCSCLRDFELWMRFPASLAAGTPSGQERHDDEQFWGMETSTRGDPGADCRGTSDSVRSISERRPPDMCERHAARRVAGIPLRNRLGHV